MGNQQFQQQKPGSGDKQGEGDKVSFKYYFYFNQFFEEASFWASNPHTFWETEEGK